MHRSKGLILYLNFSVHVFRQSDEICGSWQLMANAIPGSQVPTDSDCRQMLIDRLTATSVDILLSSAAHQSLGFAYVYMLCFIPVL